MNQIQIEFREIVKRGGRRERLRRLLADKKWHTTAEVLTAAGSGVSSRLHELREGADGLPAWEIEARRDADGVWAYRLVGEFVPGRNPDDGGAA